MKAIFKKTAALAASAILTATLAVPAMSAFADGESWIELPAQNGLVDFAATDGPYFNKSITLHNDDPSVKVYVPAVTYTYAIAGVEASGKVTDKNDSSVNTKMGPEGGLTLVSETFQFSEKDTAKELTDADGDGKGEVTITEKVKVSYDESKFTAAGIYRYEITETADYADYGITRSADSVTRLVDVYVEQNSDGTGFKVYGAVMLYEVPGEDGVTISTEKTDGFTDAGEKTGTKEDDVFTPTTEKKTDPTAYIADQLYTYNYTVEKLIQNSLIGDETFPFTVTVNGTDGKQFFNYSDAAADSAAAAIAAATTKGTVGTADSDVELADKKFLALTAVPANATILVSEKNTQTATYTVTVEDGTKSDLAVDATTISKDQSSKFSAAAAISNYADDKTTEPTKSLGDTTFTNKMVSISPTGVIFMIAPFVIMLGAGAFLLGLFMKNRKKDAAESII